MSDIQFIRAKYRELAEENNKLRDEIRALKEENILLHKEIVRRDDNEAD